MVRHCPECGGEEIDASEEPAFCLDCGEEVPEEEEQEEEEDSRYKGIVVGCVLEVEPVPKKDKLKHIKVDLGEGKTVKIATNTKYVKEGERVVVATVGAMIGDEPVKKTSVGGMASEGILCDSVMLGWKGGGKGNAVTLPDSFALGSKPPESRPRKK